MAGRKPKGCLSAPCGLLVLVVIFSRAGAPQAAALSPLHVQAGLIAEQDAIEPGRDFWIGLRFQLEEGWHIYWVNPGDSGEPPRVQWQLPLGFRAGPIQWPTPQRIEDHSLIDYGYQDEVLLLVPIHVPGKLGSGPAIELGAQAKWLVCKEKCISEQADLTLRLRVQKNVPEQPSRWHELFRKARASLPKRIPRDWRVATISARDRFILTLETGAPETKATFFPLEPDQIENQAPQEIRAFDRGVRLSFQKSDRLLKPISSLKGVVVLNSGKAFVIDAPVVLSN